MAHKHADIDTEESKKTIKRHRFVRRWIPVGLRCLVYSAIAVVMVGLGAFIYLQTESGQTRFKGAIKKALEERFAGQLRIGKITGDLFFSFSFEDIQISGPKRPILEAD